MIIERTKNSIRNSIWGIIQKAISCIAPFVVRTILIHRIGAEYAGLGNLFSSILHILSLSEFGLTETIVFCMYKPIAEDDKKTIRGLLYLFKRLYRYIGFFILILGVLISPFLPKMIAKGYPRDINLYILYGIYLINTVISYFFFAYKSSILTAFQRVDLISKSTLIGNIILYLMQIVVILLTENYYVFTILIPVTTVLVNYLNSKQVDKCFSEYIVYEPAPMDALHGFSKKLMGMFIWKVGGATRNTFDSIAISLYLGLTAVTIYTNYFYIINAVIVILGVFVSSISAGIGNKLAISSEDENFIDYNVFQLLFMWISGMCFTIMLCVYQPFMLMWMGDQYMLSNFEMLLFCIYFFFLKLFDINAAYYGAAGLWWEGRWRSIIESVINISLNFILGKVMGISGILLATIISILFAYFYGSTFIYRYYFKKQNIKFYYSTNLLYTIIILTGACVAFVISEILQSVLTVHSLIIVIILRGVVAFTVPCMIYIFAFRFSPYYSDAQKFIERIIENKLKRYN